MEIEIIIISLILSGFFSGIEIAYISANKLKIELLKNQGTFSGRVLSLLTSSPSKFLGTMLVGNNIALIVLGIMMSRLLEPAIGELLPAGFNNEFSILLIQTIIITVMVLIVGEFLPKAIFRIKPNGFLSFFSLPLLAIYYLLYPIVQVVVSISKFTLKNILQVDYKESEPIFSKVDLEHFINQFVKNENEEEEDELNTDIFEKALYLTKVKARECMVPRTELEAIDVQTSIDDLRKKFVETKLSRLIVFDETIDNILGYVHHFDLLKQPSGIREILFPIKVIPESMPAKDILNIFISDRKSIAWVVDEFGGTAGIITLEDVLEEIFGEIQDEHDSEEFIEKQIFEDEFIFSGRLEVDYLNEKYNIGFPEGEYETLAGYIVSNHENIPDQGEDIIIDNFKFKILNVGETRIETIKLKILDKKEAE